MLQIQQFHSDILLSINQFLNPVDQYFLRGVCRRFRSYFSGQCKPTIGQLIQYGYLNLLIQYKLIGQYPEFRLLYSAIQHGHLDIVQYLVFDTENGQNIQKCDLNSNTCAIAAQYGQLHILKWLRENKCPWNESTCMEAAENGNLEVLKWARSQGCPWGRLTCLAAAERGHLETLKWACENSCHGTVDICEYAALHGHLEVIQWARSQYISQTGYIKNPYSWNKWVCLYAAKNGFLHILQWARSQGCPWNRDSCNNFALQNNHQHIVDWIDAN